MVTAGDVANLAQALSSEQALEQFVATLPPEQVPVYLARLLDAATNVRALTKGLEQRLAADGQTGQHFMVGNTEYGFFGAQAKGFRDIPGLFANLLRVGLSIADLSAAASEVRVTDLRASAALLKDPEKQAEALALIEGDRVAKGERGAPTFKVITETMKAAMK